MSHQYKYTQDRERRSGRSTMAALNYVQLILDNPGTWIEIEDHGPTIQCDRQLFDLVCRVLNALQVDVQTNKLLFRIKCTGPPQPYEYPSADSILDALRPAKPYSRKGLDLF